ncbi:MAG: adenylyltransferase/cytidyltransferase family protein [Phycisphaera sp.]|nr:adenylyltransferase/cytidyltransferase family protein [Phycisphaera sp.]
MKVMVSGCFDLFHAGHVEFLRRAAEFGRLYVCLGSDETIRSLKGRYPVCNERQRAEVVGAIRWVHDVCIGSGSGWLDFEPEMKANRPDVFVVNDDGDRAEKRRFCESLGVAYEVLRRTPRKGIDAISSSAIRDAMPFPYRVEIVGGWLDQPFVSRLHPGPVVVASVEADERFTQYTGLAGSSRQTAIDLWGGVLPSGDAVRNARVLFACDNAPGISPHVSGSQDHLGLLLAGVNRLDYSGDYWPQSITSIVDESTLSWLESVLSLVPLGIRSRDYDPLRGRRITKSSARRLAEAADDCWEAICKKDAQRLGRALNTSLGAQLAMFPSMMPREVARDVESVTSGCLGAKMTGAGGGGYLLGVGIVSQHAVPIRIRRPKSAIATHEWV